MTRIKRLLGTLLLLTGVAATPASATLVLDLNTGGSPNPCGTCGAGGETFGWGFRVINAITINQLGLFDTGADGLGVAGVQTGIWTTGGTLLASVTVTDASEQVASASADGEWLFEGIGSLLLTPGSYVIGSIFLGSVPLAQVGAPFTTIVDIALTGGVRSGGANDGFAFPDTTFSEPIFGPTMRMAQVVPEPASVLLAALGLVLVGLSRRSRAKAS